MHPIIIYNLYIIGIHISKPIHYARPRTYTIFDIFAKINIFWNNHTNDLVMTTNRYILVYSYGKWVYNDL